MNVLDELWNDYFAPEVKRCKLGSEYHKFKQILRSRKVERLEELSSDGQEVLERFERTKDTMALISEKDTFIDGFRMGAGLMLDLFCDSQRDFE